MSNENPEIINRFPGPGELQSFLKRDIAISLLRRTLEASRAAVDEITCGAERVLTVDEQMALGIVAESLALAAIEVSTWTTTEK